MRQFIARDTKEPLVVLGGYRIAHDGSVIHEPIKQRIDGQDYGSDPVGDGVVRMVPSGRIVTAEESRRILGR